MFGVSVAKNPGTYLGIPSLWGKTRLNALSYVKERLISKVKNWKKQSLPNGGKEFLIKSVASAVPIYYMSCFKFPKKLCNEMNEALAHFWEDISSFGGWLEEIFSLFKGNMQNALDMKLRIAFSCWIIWKEQCEAIFNGSTVSDKRAINRVKIGMVELCELQDKQSDCGKKTISNNRETLLW
ncbi:hypothetical protein J1N35_032565 [Gossypium stocksii]|uniref:Reverse transcriptase zinc-binding domain-containing protein n=1 Tax=Gossypium stocksii TaxID=47602 RepID=A0A9D3V3I7_9ROSI|nr:hypothetical protein J1N35_032565 [Gossypium stocksii]